MWLCFCSSQLNAETITVNGREFKPVAQAVASGGISRPVRLSVSPGQLVIIDAEAVVEWLLLEPDSVGITKHGETALAFAVPTTSPRVLIWAFRASEAGVPIPRVYIFTITGNPTPPVPVPPEPKPPGPDNPDPKPPLPPAPAPVVPNDWGVGKPVYDAVAALHAAHRTRYCKPLADIWDGAASKLAAVPTISIDEVMEGIGAASADLLGSDARNWNPFGDAVERAIQAGLDSGKIVKNNRDHAIGLAREVAAALRLAEGAK